jgi:ABC-2 type transport system permease protein
MMVSRLLLTLPGMIVPIVFGAWLYHIPLTINLWILILLPIAGLALSSMGMALGVLVENLEILHMITNVLMFIMVMATPVFIPVEALPVPLQIFGFLMPPTYAAEALRKILLGITDSAFYLNLSILLGMTIAGFIIVNRWLRIRLV